MQASRAMPHGPQVSQRYAYADESLSMFVGGYEDKSSVFRPTSLVLPAINRSCVGEDCGMRRCSGAEAGISAELSTFGPLKPLKKEGDGSFRPPPAVLVLFYADNSSVSFSPALPTSGGRRCRPHPDRWPSGTPARRPLSCFRRCRPRCRSQIFTLQNWRYSHAQRRNALRDTGARHRWNGESGRRRQSRHRRAYAAVCGHRQARLYAGMVEASQRADLKLQQLAQRQ